MFIPNRMTAQKNTVVTMCYVVKDSSGKILDDTHASTPVKFVCGHGRFFPEIERQIQGLGPGQNKTVRIPPELGYGKRKKENTIKIRKSDLPETDCVVGGLFRRINTNLESKVYTITGYVGEWLFLDNNHPWAGKKLFYEIRIVDVEPGYHKKSLLEKMMLEGIFKLSGNKESDNGK
ncbi:MAG: FKBP-type peptidyl-prolyl cis-trans isomerase [Desulfosarcina sp.]|nr:FKBP-type peptidyl-prolyl cis-trans isomerase [Desulfobacterales bacterium]